MGNSVNINITYAINEKILEKIVAIEADQVF